VERTFNPHDPRHLLDGVPFDVLAEIRQHHGIVRTPAGAWYLSRHADVVEVLSDVRSFGADLGPMSGVRSVDDVPPDQHWLSEIDEPRHGRIRRLFNASFGPQRTRAVEPFVRRACEYLLDDLVDRSPADLHTGYAARLPGLVMAHVLGLPADAAARFMAWSADASILRRPASPGVEPGGPGIQAYFAHQLAAQRSGSAPVNAVFRFFIEAELDGEPLSDQEIVSQLHFMVQAGVHTTRGLLVHAVQRLVQVPTLFALLQRDRTRIEPFIEECLRLDAPVQRVTRRCRREATVAGTDLRPGDWIEVGIASANRDEAVYDDPETFRLDRLRPRDHLSFGTGPHVCPGALLARCEAVTAVDVLVDRVDALRPVDGAHYPPLPGSLGHGAVPAVLVVRGS